MRKRIAVFMSELVAEYQKTVLRTIFAEANGLGYDVFVFAGYGSYDNNVLYAEGEKNLIKIPELSTYDGIIIADDTFDIYGMDQELSELLDEKANCPIVYIRDKGNGNHYSITFDDVNTMAQMTRHFIEDRGVTDLCFMSGPLDMDDAVYRQQGFMEAMSEAGLLVYDRMLFEGDYWRLKGKEAIDYFMKDRDTYPRGIICSNDQMALSVIYELKSRGVRVPEDVYVSGYDNLEEGKACKPGLTTVQVSHIEMSKMAVHVIDDVCHGKEAERHITIKGTPVYRRSTNENLTNEDYDVTWLLEEVDARYDLAKKAMDVSAHCANALDMNDIFRAAERFFPNNNAKIGYICLCDENEDFRVGDNGKAFSDNMILWGTFHHDAKVGAVRSAMKFIRSLVLPETVTDRPQPSAYIVFPIHYLSKEYGYLVMEYDDKQWVNLLTGAYMQCLADAFEDVNKKRELASLEELKHLYVMDPLTGLYNRRGFEQKLQQMYEKVIDGKGVLSIISIDMDGLKFINDKYGHNEGDAALVKLADVLKGLVRDNEICARIGGDEFSVLLYSNDNSRQQQFEQIFPKIVEMENEKWDKPYSLHASMGSYCVMDNSLPLLACMKIADQRMYTQKRMYKKRMGLEPR